MPTGALDSSFGSAGVVLDSSMEFCSVLAIQTTGHLPCLDLLSGNGPMARYEATGKSDTSFGNAGVLEPPVGPDIPDEDVMAFALQADDKIVTGGDLHASATSPSRHAVLRRWSPSGTADQTFPLVTITAADYVQAVVILRDGRALVSMADSNGLDTLLSRIWM